MPEIDPEDSNEPFLLFVAKLNAIGVRYMVSGSVAAMYYGEPRLTNDVDIVLFLESADLSAFIDAFPLKDFYCPPLEVIQVESARDLRGHFNLIHHRSGFKADIYPVGRDPLHQWAAERTEEAEVEGVRVVFAPAEYVIVRKLQYFREGGAEKHLRDIRRMVCSLGDEWDQTALRNLVAEHRLEEHWQLAINFGS